MWSCWSTWRPRPAYPRLRSASSTREECKGGEEEGRREGGREGRELPADCALFLFDSIDVEVVGEGGQGRLVVDFRFLMSSRCHLSSGP